MSGRVASIVHPAEFSDARADVFAHALKIALATKCKLYLLHVDGDPPVIRSAAQGGRKIPI